jgi:hypothetical protein
MLAHQQRRWIWLPIWLEKCHQSGRTGRFLVRGGAAKLKEGSPEPKYVVIFGEEAMRPPLAWGEGDADCQAHGGEAGLTPRSCPPHLSLEKPW